jgi:hypothetical protein
MFKADQQTMWVFNAVQKHLSAKYGEDADKMFSFEIAVVAVRALDEYRRAVLDGKIGPES